MPGNTQCAPRIAPTRMSGTQKGPKCMTTSVLIVDDTVVYRKILAEVVGPLVDGGTVATAPSGALALKKLAQNKFDVVLLDVQMPEMDGIETLTRIRAEFPAVAVVMVSAATAKGSETAIKALNLGALDLIQKPQGRDAADSTRQLRAEIGTVLKVIATRRLMACGRSPAGPMTAPAGAATAIAPPPLARPATPIYRGPRLNPVPGTFNLLAVGASTGGPEALSRVIPHLPGDFPLPVVLVQHMPPVFTAALADDLDRKSPLRVKEAADGDPVVPGTVLIACGGRHMTVKGEGDALVTRMDDGPPENSCKPAVDVLFRSIGNAAGSRNVLAVVLTGMGADGALGVRTLKQKRCYCITQSAVTCVVYGMPHAVDEAGLSDESMDIGDIAARVSALAGRNRSAA
jgi:two-component system, chemotaxis family, protein-glutamate methylesterase/glutaminase